MINLIKICTTALTTLCICASLQAQPGRGPGGPPVGPGGPGGGRSMGPGGPGGPPPGADFRQRGPSGGPGRSYGRDTGPGGPMPGRYAPPPGGDPHGPYSRNSVPSNIPSTRFGSAPGHHFDAPNRGSMPPGHAAQREPSPAGGPPDTGRMQRALRSGDYATIHQESQGIRTRAERMERMNPDLPVQDRIQLPLIKHMYRQGADLMEEGRNSRDDTKIRMGIQQINQANEKLNRMNGPENAPPRRGDR